jgi:hypothetical protein
MRLRHEAVVLLCVLWGLACATGPQVGPQFVVETWPDSEGHGVEAFQQIRPPVRLPPRGAASPGRGPRRRGQQRERNAEPIFNAEPTPEQREAVRRQAEIAAVYRQQQAKYRRHVEEANRLYPDKVGRYEEHHFVPQYLGGLRDGKTYKVLAPYHQLLTNAFRAEHAYGQAPPSPQRLQEILIKVYSEYPIPQQIGIPEP